MTPGILPFALRAAILANYSATDSRGTYYHQTDIP